MNTFENIILTVLIVISPAGLIYGWFFNLTRMRSEAPSWRKRITFVSLILVSIAILLWPMMMLGMPRADWATGTGVAQQAHWVEAWERVELRIFLGAFVLAFFGRPRLILPIVVTCVGGAMFWVFSNVP